MANTLESLELEITHNSSGAAGEIGKVTASLGKLGKTIERVFPQLKALSEAFSSIANPIVINDVHGNTIENTMQKVSSAGKSAAKNVAPLSEEIQDAISNMDKYTVLVEKASIAEEKMQNAFQKGDAAAAIQARGQVLNLEEQQKREWAKMNPEIPAAATPVSGAKQAIISTANEIDLLKMKLESLNAAMQQAFGEGNAEKAAQYRYQILQTEKALERARKAADGASKGVQELAKETKKSEKPMSNFVASLKRIAFYRFIRSIIKSITQAFSDGLEKAYLFSQGITGEGNRFAQALDRMKSSSNSMKGQIGSAFISLLAILEPIIQKIINLVIKVADAISQLFSAFTGKTYLKANATAAQFADNMKKGGAAAKEWKNQLLGFDEINRLNEPSNGGGGGGTNPLAGYSFEDTPLEDWAQKIHDNLALIETIASGFALAMGLILTLTGANVPLGLGLIAVGVAGLFHALTEDWDSVSGKVASTMHNIMVVAGISMLGIGLILALSGANIPVGLALIAAGAVSLISAAAIRWGLDGEVGAELNKITRVASLGMFAIGLILALTGNLPLGLGIMGASLFAYATTINWDAMLDGMKKTWRGITNWYHEKVEKYFTKEWWQEQIDLIMPDWGKIFRGLINWCISAHNWIQDVLDGISLINGGGENVHTWAGTIERPRAYASGGFPDEGQLFFARENGMPEMVGQIGSQTAVANNDQIVEGIRQGVYDAVVAANANGNSDVSVRVYLDSREIKAGQQRLNRAWGV